MTNDLAVVLPVITLIIGAILGLVSSTYVTYIQKRDSISIKLLEQFFKVRDEICDKLSGLASLKIGDPVDPKHVTEVREGISRLAYKYYDILPPQVLREIYCLHACLGDSKNRIFRCKDNLVVPITEDHELQDFISDISLVDNLKAFGLVPLKSRNDAVKKSACINYQARCVLKSLNDHFTINHLMSWARALECQNS